MKISFKHLIALLFFVLIFAVSKQVFAQNFPDKPAKLVSDFAKIFSAQENDLLEEKLLKYNNETSTQIAVVTITSLDGYPIDDYTIKLANKWQIGQKGKNNGLLILIAAKDHKVFIASGYGMEGVLNDGKIGTIIRTQMIPQFKSGNYYAGTNDGIDAMISAAVGEYVNDEKQQNNVSPIPAILIILFIIILLFKSRTARYAALGSILYGNNRGGSGGGFGGFGGGGFGGGGAGGSW